MEVTSRFDDALQFAVELHRDQYRKSTTTPYASHLLAVSALTMEFGGNENQAIAALLHDSIEDQAPRFGGAALLLEVLDRRYGSTVASIVVACTDSDTIPKKPWRERKQTYIAHVPRMTADAALVSICDKLHNARSILADYASCGDAVFDRFNAGKDGVVWYYGALAAAFRQYHPQPAANELERVVAALVSVATPKPALPESLERPPFLPGDDCKEWSLLPDAAGFKVMVVENKTTHKFWLRYGPALFGTPDESAADGILWGELTPEEALEVSSSSAGAMLQSRRVLVDTGKALAVRGALRTNH